MISNQLEVVTALWFKFPNMICHMTMFFVHSNHSVLYQTRYAIIHNFAKPDIGMTVHFTPLNTANDHPEHPAIPQKFSSSHSEHPSNVQATIHNTLGNTLATA